MVDNRNTFDSGPMPADDIADTAAMWLARCDRGLSTTEERELAAWRAADSRHEAEFSRLRAEWGDFDLAKADPELVAMAQALDDRTRTTLRPKQQRRMRAWSYAFMAAAAAVAVLLAVNALRRGTPETDSFAVAAPTYQVVPSASRQLTLADGSTVTLRGDSEVEADFTPTERRVRLQRGEAHFAVTKDPARPFIVSAGGVAVRAVGTAFNVRVDPTTIEVLVTEGKVRVNDTARDEPLVTGADAPEPPVLVAGQRIILPATPVAIATAPVAVMSPAEIEQALAWQSTRLVFERTPLFEAVTAFNQHGCSRIVLGDASLHHRLLGGTFRADNVDGFVRLLELTADVRAERRSDGTLVLWPAP